MITDAPICTVRHVDHVGIAVANVEEAKALFQMLFGAPDTEILEDSGRNLRAALLEIGQTRIELLESTDPENVIGRFVASRGGGLHHIAFQVEDIKERLASLKKAGIPLVNEEPVHGFTGNIAFIRPEAVEHVLVELVQPHPKETK
jgi:methylmalonyl-CoA/ethylmalonyl-CoA epimerase